MPHHRRTRARRAARWCAGFSILLAAMTAVAAPPATPVDTARETGELTTPDTPVEVVEPTRDQDIAGRLRRILDATGRHDDVHVEVRDGVVVLTGHVRDNGRREWAGDLARRAQGVVAVINDLEIAARPIWTLEPAVRETRELWRQLINGLPLIVLGLFVLIMVIAVALGIVRLLSGSLRRRVPSELVRNVLEKIVLVLVVLVGLFLFLRITGLSRMAVTLAGGTGLVGLIIGFAFREIAENFLASILISLQRPFRIGDTIEIAGHLGVVRKVTTRDTVLMDFDGNHVQIPNATVYKGTIRNYTANPNRRLAFTVGIGYDASVTAAQDVALNVLRAHSAVLEEPEPLVLVEQLGAATIQIRVYFWIDGQRHSILKVRSSVMRLVMRALEDAGVSLPDEAREVIFPQGVPVRMIDAAPAPARAAPPPPAPASEFEERREASDAEGDLRSEVAELDRQAKAARAPDEGKDILGGA